MKIDRAVPDFSILYLIHTIQTESSTKKNQHGSLWLEKKDCIVRIVVPQDELGESTSADVDAIKLKLKFFFFFFVVGLCNFPIRRTRQKERIGVEVGMVVTIFPSFTFVFTRGYFYIQLFFFHSRRKKMKREPPTPAIALISSLLTRDTMAINIDSTKRKVLGHRRLGRAPAIKSGKQSASI